MVIGYRLLVIDFWFTVYGLQLKTFITVKG